MIDVVVVVVVVCHCQSKARKQGQERDKTKLSYPERRKWNSAEDFSVKDRSLEKQYPNVRPDA